MLILNADCAANSAGTAIRLSPDCPPLFEHRDCQNRNACNPLFYGDHAPTRADNFADLMSRKVSIFQTGAVCSVRRRFPCRARWPVSQWTRFVRPIINRLGVTILSYLKLGKALRLMANLRRNVTSQPRPANARGEAVTTAFRSASSEPRSCCAIIRYRRQCNIHFHPAIFRIARFGRLDFDGAEGCGSIGFKNCANSNQGSRTAYGPQKMASLITESWNQLVSA